MKPSQQDTMHKSLFAIQDLIADLVVHYAPIEWRDQIDLESLEEISHQVVDETLTMRYCDSVWRAKLKAKDGARRPVFVMVLTEFQSSPQWFMAVRMINYMSAIYLRLVKQNRYQEMVLPLILPFVIYNGVRIWNASLNVADLTGPVDVEWVRRIFGVQNYWVIDLKRMQLSASGEVNNLIELMAKAQQAIGSGSLARVDQMFELMEEYLQGRGNAALNLEFAQWVMYFICKQNEEWLQEMKLDEIEIESIENIEAARRSWEMIHNEIRAQGEAIGIAKGEARGMAKGEARGMAKGEARGMAKGEAIGIAKGEARAKAKELENNRKLLSDQIELKFGVASMSQLQDQLASIENLAQVHLISKWIIECDGVEELSHRLNKLVSE